jgi:amino acid adenylation domain-containing protein
LAAVDLERGAQLTYAELETVANEIRAALEAAGVRGGDRVGIDGPKSLATLCSLLGVLKTGAAYVPVDPDAPPERNAYIFADCSVRALIVEASRLDELSRANGELQLDVFSSLDVLAFSGVELLLVRNTADQVEAASANVPELAYILYTSGSTGRPKGVMHTHASAMSFVDWCTETFAPSEADRFSSHAPFHFDLSILDIYLPLKHGAAIFLIGEHLGKQPANLAEAISESRISMWYSTPSVLRLLVDYGTLDRLDFGALRVVNFAGEVFPVKHLRALKDHWRHARFFNLYGPTETNVCTWYEVPEMIPSDRNEPYPIGKVCSNDLGWIVDENGGPVPTGEEGELYVSGGSVMAGYWNLPARSEQAFAVGEDGTRWYRTGDVVRENDEGDLLFLGRRDRMVKRRGYRVELGEIEAALYRHPDISEAAVVAVPDEESGVLISAYVIWEGQDRPSTIKLKNFSADNLPLYMVPDRFAFPALIPKTSTDKVDYQRLAGLEN